jgi:hypothetical protein
MRRLVIASVSFSASVAAAQPAEQPAEPAAPPPVESAPAAVPPATEAPPPKVDAKPHVDVTYDNGFKLESDDGKFEVKLQFRNQVRFQSDRATEDGSQFLNHFEVPRTRLQAEGHVFSDATRFKAELGMGDAGSYAGVKDVFIEHRVSPAPVFVRAGQWKRPFNRQEMVSDFASQFNERSIENELAGGGRDLGVAVHNDYEKTAEGIEWVFGVFNGFSGGRDRPIIPSVCATSPTGSVTCVNGRATNVPTDFGPTFVARAGWNSAHAKGYSEADIEGGPLRYSIAAAYKIDLANFAKHGEPSLADNLSHGLELDWNIKNNGFSFSGGVVMMKLKSADPQYGLVVQPGLMVVPKHAEIAARFALTTDDDDRDRLEALGAFNYYVHGHRMKIATDFGILMLTGEDPMTMATDKPDIRVRVMGQLEL